MVRTSTRTGEVVVGGDLGFVRLAKMIHKYRPLILDTLDHGLSNARSKATNLTSNSGVKQGAGQCVDGGVALRPGPAPVAGEADQRLPVAVEGGGQAQCRAHRLFEQLARSAMPHDARSRPLSANSSRAADIRSSLRVVLSRCCRFEPPRRSSAATPPNRSLPGRFRRRS